MALDRSGFSVWVDDDGSGTTGTVLTKARVDADILDPIDAAAAFVNAENTFEGDQTINGDLFVTGTITPLAQAARKAFGAKEGEENIKMLVSSNAESGIVLTHDAQTGYGEIATANYDTGIYHDLILEANAIHIFSGGGYTRATRGPNNEHMRFHASGGLTVGTGHDTDPGYGIVQAQGLGTTPLDASMLTSGQMPPERLVVSAASRVLGRGDTGGGPVQELALGSGLEVQGTTIVATAKNSSQFGYGFSTQTTEPPARETARLNAGHPYTAVTKAWIDFQNANSEDLYWPWMRVPLGSVLLVQDKDTHTQYAEFTTTGAPIDKGTYVEFPVSWRANGTALATQACLVRATTQPVSASAAEGDLEARLQALEARVAALETGGGL